MESERYIKVTRTTFDKCKFGSLVSFQTDKGEQVVGRKRGDDLIQLHPDCDANNAGNYSRTGKYHKVWLFEYDYKLTGMMEYNPNFNFNGKKDGE